MWKKKKEVDYKSVFCRMRRRFRHLEEMKDGREFFHMGMIHLQHSGPTCMYYRDGIVAIGFTRSVQILELETKLRVVSQVDLAGCGYAHCIHVDDSYLVVGTGNSRVIAYKMPTMEKLYSEISYSGPVLSLTFNKDIDLLVTASRIHVSFWRLSSGTVHFTRPNGHYDLQQLHLISSPNLQNDCDYVLLCMYGYSCFRYLFDSRRIASNETGSFLLCWLEEDYCSTVCGYLRNPFHYFIRRVWATESSTLVKYDTVSGELNDIRRFNSVHVELVGVGRKYAFLLVRVHEDGPKRKVIVYDLATESEFASFTIPGEPMRFLQHAICLDHASWLDGFDGFNDKGVFLVTEFQNRPYVLKWPD